eukprot:gene8587-10566_t
MDDADEIILITLKDLGCELEDNISIKEFDTDIVYKCLIAYFKVINSDKISNLTSGIPKNMSARVNACSLLANLVKELGYRGELSYHNILYPNVNDIRRIFIFLGQNLPKKEVGGSGGKGAVKIEDEICQYLQGCAKESWFPYFCPFSKRIPGNYSTAKMFTTVSVKIPSRGRQLKLTPGLEEYYSNYLRPLTSQPNRRDDLAPSVFEYNLSIYAEAQERDNEWSQKGSNSGLNPLDYKKNKQKQVQTRMNDAIRSSLVEGSASGDCKTGCTFAQLICEFGGGLATDNHGQFSRKKIFGNEQSELTTVVTPTASGETEEERAAKKQQEIDALQARLNAISEKMQTVTQAMEGFVSMMRQSEAENNEQDARREVLEKEYKVKKRTFALLEDAEGNIKQLQDICNQTSQNLLELAAEWERVRRPIIDKYRTLKDQLNNSQDETKAKLDRVKEMRVLIKKMAQEIQSKEELFGQLQESYKSSPKDANRSIYTRRILETVKNIKKQKVDIDKILLDTKALHKEINSITDTAVRTFELVKDMLYNDAKKDPTAKQAIQSFAVIDTKFQKLVKAIDETGTFQNNILSLNSKIDHITQKTNTQNSDRLINDLKNIKSENVELIKTIKSKMEVS